MRRMFTKEEVAFKVASSSITQLTNKEINELKAGDIVTKKTDNQYHTYIVSYKEDGQGICLTYSAAGYQETVSYDLIDGVWTYNSTDVVLINQLEEIKDKDGNLRFIEGTPTYAEQTGVDIKYKKWSLSGTHLMIVIAGSIENGVTCNSGTLYFGLSNLPLYVREKITTVWANYVSYIAITTHDDSWSTNKTIGFSLKRDSITSINIQNQNSVTNDTGSTQNFRVQFDLLIDNE